MSFSANLKEELSKINIFSNVNLVKAEFYGYLMTANSKKNKVVFLTENEYNINRLNKLLNKLNINYKIKMHGKNYKIEFDKSNIEIEEEVLESADAKKAMVRGAFLGGGSITEPNTRYHLEITLKEKEGREKTINAINVFGIEVKSLNRKYSYSIYIKDGEEISKLLALMGASRAVLIYEDIRVLKDTKNNINRKVNCETSNLTKTVNAAVDQIEAINKLKKNGKLKTLSPILQEMAEVRLQNPEATLKELGEMLNVPIRQIRGKS